MLSDPELFAAFVQQQIDALAGSSFRAVPEFYRFGDKAYAAQPLTGFTVRWRPRKGKFMWTRQMDSSVFDGTVGIYMQDFEVKVVGVGYTQVATELAYYYQLLPNLYANPPITRIEHDWFEGGTDATAYKGLLLTFSAPLVVNAPPVGHQAILSASVALSVTGSTALARTVTVVSGAFF